MADARDDERDLNSERREEDIGIGAIAPHDSLVARRRGCRLVRAMRMRRMFLFCFVCRGWVVMSGPSLELVIVAIGCRVLDNKQCELCAVLGNPIIVR
jgi:hypothetical protein